MRAGWDQLTAMSVRIAPELQVHIGGIGRRAGLSIPVVSHADIETSILYLREAGELSRPSGGGRAMASLFASDPRRLAQAWLAACVEAEQGRRAAEIWLASERRAENERSIEVRLANLQSEIGKGGRLAEARADSLAPKRSSRSSQSERTDGGSSSERVLIDPNEYRVVEIEVGAPGPAAGPTLDRLATGVQQPKTLPLPQAGSSSPKSRTAAAGYTQVEREAIGLDLLRKVLASDDRGVRDLRAQRGLGADAVDEAGRYWELKVYAGPEPDYIIMEGSQLARAASDPDFWLVVVSGVERGQGRPRVRIIPNPLVQLQPMERSSLRMAGIQAARSLVREFDELEDKASDQVSQPVSPRAGLRPEDTAEAADEAQSDD